MYFKFHDNLPKPVVRGIFHFCAENDPEGRLGLVPGNISGGETIVEVPSFATHIQAIRFYTPLNTFFYVYPGTGYALADGGCLPPLQTLLPGDVYADGIVMRTGTDGEAEPVEEEIIPFKGKVLALEEEEASYQDGVARCQARQKEKTAGWHLPDVLELTNIHRNKEALNAWLSLHGGALFSDTYYWCRDDSVIELGVRFHMALGQLSIAPKEQLNRIRLVCDY